MTDTLYTPPWFLQLSGAHVAAAIRYFEECKASGLPTPSPVLVSTTKPHTTPFEGSAIPGPRAWEQASTCLYALQALKRGKIHRANPPSEYRNWYKDRQSLQSATPTILGWEAAEYALRLAAEGGKYVIYYLQALSSGTLYAVLPGQSRPSNVLTQLRGVL